MAFVGRVDDLKSAADPKFQMEKEGKFIKRKIEEVEAEMKQMEGNMAMFNFKSASGEAMKKDMEKKIERARQDVQRMKAQHKQLMQEMRAPVPVPAPVPPPADTIVEEAAEIQVTEEAPTSEEQPGSQEG